MEFLILAMIAAVVVKRGVEDIIDTAKGNSPPRRAASAQRRKSGAAGRYWRQLWDDTWDDMLKRHTEKRDLRDSRPRPVRDPSQMRTVFTQFGDDFGNWARATWRYGWNKLAAKQQDRRLKRSSGRRTVPGTVVPNVQDEDEDRPQDGPAFRPEDETGDRPLPDPLVVPDEDGTPTEDGPASDAVPDLNSGPDSGPDNDIAPPLDPTTEGTPTMTATTGELIGLDDAIRFCADSAQAYRAQSHQIELAKSGLLTAQVGGPAVALLDQAAEQADAAARFMDSAKAEFDKQKAIQEQYVANPDAGSKEFLLANR